MLVASLLANWTRPLTKPSISSAWMMTLSSLRPAARACCTRAVTLNETVPVELIHCPMLNGTMESVEW